MYFAELEDINIENDDSLIYYLQKKFLLDYMKGPIRGVETGLRSHFPYLTHTNAFYDPTTNKIRIPIAIMQPPLFWTIPSL